MDNRDFESFVQMLDDVWGFYPKAMEASPGQKAIFFRALADFSLFDVRKGFDRHVKDSQRGRFPPLPADVIAQIEDDAENDRRPGPEEAWAIALQARDEARTLVWTDEIAQAWGTASQLGDQVSARMAFKEAYTRLVAEARSARRPAKWFATLGADPEQRDEALQRAHAAGLLAAPQRVREPLSLTHALSPSNTSMPAEVREKLAALRERLVSKVDEPTPDAPPPHGAFRLIPDECLPPGMRKKPAAQSEEPPWMR